MKRKSLLYLSAFLMTAIVLGSCSGLKKMKDKASLVKYTPVPEVLEMKGGDVEAAVNIRYPEKYFNKKAVLTLTPVLKYDGGEVEYPAYTVQGEGVKANNKVVKYAEGGSISIPAAKVPFKEGMRVSELHLKVTASVKNNSVEFPSVKVGDGVMASELLVEKQLVPVMLADKFSRVNTDVYETEIIYLINQAEVRTTETRKSGIKGLTDYVKAAQKNERIALESAVVSAYASPDGPIDLNTNLSEKRKQTAQSFLTRELKSAKVEELKKDDFLSLMSTPEDWDGFKKLMEQSDIKDKELILRVLSMYSDPVVREREIKNISAAYTEIADKILPQLRRSKLKIKTQITGYSDEELSNLAATNPSILNVEEILYAATLAKDLDQKLKIYQAAAQKFPNDVRPQNNVGYVLIKQNKLADAKAAFEKAKSIEDNATVKNNLGVVAFLEGDTKKAEELFTSASGSIEAVNYNLGTLSIISGKYSEAVNYFGNTPSFNAALARLLAKQHDAAMSTAGNVKDETAKVFYLKAIIGARTQNTDVLFSNLRTAVGKDSALKAYAKKDMEFGKYFQDQTFKSIVD